MLTEQEKLRYSRQLILPEIGVEGQVKIKNARVLVIGVGGLGCPASLYLAASGVGTIGIMDYDLIEESNLQRQILYTHNEIGQPKATMAAKKLTQLNPLITIKPLPVKFTYENALTILDDYDIIIDGTDNFASRYLINDACVIKNKPWVFGSISRFEGQVSVFNDKDGPTYRCLFPELRSDNPEDCSTIGVLPALPGIIGSILANEVIKIITGTGDTLSGRLLVIDTKSMSTTVIHFKPVQENKVIKELRITNYELRIHNSQFTIHNSFNTGSPVTKLTYPELQSIIKSKEPLQLIDVRELAEHEAFNIGGINIPFSEIDESADKLNKKQAIILYCSNGLRSAQSALLLQHKGFERIYSLEGGVSQLAK